MVALFKKKSLIHGILFLIAGVWMLGCYVIVGEDAGAHQALGWGGWAALAMIVFGAFLLVAGEKVITGDTTFVEYYDSIVVAVGLALLVRTFMVEPFKIPSGSMIPTLLVGDYLFVNKSAYGYRLPFTTKRLFAGEGPRRGDVTVFEFPQEPNKDYIKRIIGLPGDRIGYHDKQVTVNGQPLSYLPEGEYTYLNERHEEMRAQRFREQLDDREHAILVQPQAFSMFDHDITVPAGHYFVLGDNRDNSNDSRFWGFVPAYRLVGRAVFLFWSWNNVGGSPRWERVGAAVS